ncbi:hypothetical protein [Zymobacter sp. IVIA_12111.31 C1]|uniref:hypothetical protein n=1 Tax=Zymobacter sp. IVIA_12111.31 C1 TaxID=3394854 RepID=UPI0039C46C78
MRKSMATVIFLLISHINIANAELSEDISNIRIEMLSSPYETIKKCSEAGEKSCQIKLALNSMEGNSRLKDRSGEIDYKKAEHWLITLTGQSPTARLLLGRIRIQQGKTKEAKALISSSGTENFSPALDHLISPIDRIYIGEDKEQQETQSLKWELKAFMLRKDPDIAYYIAAHFITPPYKDCAAAKLWFARATEGHNANINAQQLLGEQYETGDCMPQDYVMAYMMYDLGGTAVAEQKHALAEKMTPEQINEGTLRSYQWQEQNHSYRVGYGVGNSYDIHWNIH